MLVFSNSIFSVDPKQYYTAHTHVMCSVDTNISHWVNITICTIYKVQMFSKHFPVWNAKNFDVCQLNAILLEWGKCAFHLMIKLITSQVLSHRLLSTWQSRELLKLSIHTKCTLVCRFIRRLGRICWLTCFTSKYFVNSHIFNTFSH